MIGTTSFLRFGTGWLIATSVASASAAWWVTSGHYQARISTLQRDQAQAQERAQADALQRLLAANTRADQLTARLQQQSAQMEQLTKDKNDALRRLTTGRACLSADAVRVLNSAPHGAANVFSPAPGPVAAGTGVASDSDVAGWISTAQQQHEQCRNRLGALIDFFDPQ